MQYVYLNKNLRLKPGMRNLFKIHISSTSTNQQQKKKKIKYIHSAGDSALNKTIYEQNIYASHIA